MHTRDRWVTCESVCPGQSLKACLVKDLFVFSKAWETPRSLEVQRLQFASSRLITRRDAERSSVWGSLFSYQSFRFLCEGIFYFWDSFQ